MRDGSTTDSQEYTDSMEHQEYVDNIESKTHAGSMEPQVNTDSMEPLENTGRMEPQKHAGSIQLKYIGSMESQKYTGNMESKKHADSMEPPKYVGRMEPLKYADSMEPKYAVSLEPQKYAGSILLPDTDVVFRNIKNAKRFAIDIGGSLTKIAYYSTVSHRKVMYNAEKDSAASVDGEDYHYESSETERLHFVKFETKYIEHCLDFIRDHLVFSKESMAGKSIKATGGGAYKYAELIQQKLGLTVEKEDEIGSLIKGCNFLLRNIPDEQFSYSRHDDPEYRFINTEPNIFPYLLVNIGSGVSIMKVEADDKYDRIGGTSMGGGTFWGLGSLLTKAKGFDELLQLASEGDHRNVDLLVKDIYGGDYSALGLTGGIIASSFGKAMHHGHTKSDDSPDDKCMKCHLARHSRGMGEQSIG